MVASGCVAYASRRSRTLTLEPTCVLSGELAAIAVLLITLHGVS
jgi:hypothetical protein